MNYKYILLIININIYFVYTIHEINNNLIEDTSIEFPRFIESNNNSINIDANNNIINENPANNCIDSPIAVCIKSNNNNNGGVTIISGDAIHRDLVGYWNFDGKYCQDNSGYMNYCRPSPMVGPSIDGRGSSAMFTGKHSTTIPMQPNYFNTELSITFSIFLIDKSDGEYRALIKKGNGKNMEPSIEYNPGTGRIRICISTTNDEVQVESYGKFMPHRWNYFAMVQNNRVLSLFINGRFDNKVDIPEPSALPNNYPFIIGGEEISFLLDDLRIWRRPLLTEEIQAISHAYSGIHPEFVNIGCTDCQMDIAQGSCKPGYHLCSDFELRIAKRIVQDEGWLSITNRHAWNLHSNPSDNQQELSTVGLCCLTQ